MKRCKTSFSNVRTNGDCQHGSWKYCFACRCKGICTAIVTACARTNSIGEAFRNIKHGYSDVILAGGTEATICEMGIAGFAALTALSESTDPNRGSIPFDENRNGFVMGEGAGVLVLESLEHAQARGAKSMEKSLDTVQTVTLTI